MSLGFRKVLLVEEGYFLFKRGCQIGAIISISGEKYTEYIKYQY
jgi:hypothetical protein